MWWNTEMWLETNSCEKEKMRGSKDRPELNSKKELKTKIVIWVAFGLVFIVILYFTLFVGLKEMSFFGASTKNTQALW